MRCYLFFRLVYKWFYNIHRVTYFLGIVGYLIIMGTFLGINVLLYISPDTAMGAGVTIIFYGLYYGVLGRDCAEICTDKMAAKMGVSPFFNPIIYFSLLFHIMAVVCMLYCFHISHGKVEKVEEWSLEQSKNAFSSVVNLIGNTVGMRPV